MLFDYFSAVSDPARALDLEKRMAEYYTTNHAYYEDIHFATSAWLDPNQSIHQDLLRHAERGKIAEVGCGRAQALTSGRIDYSNYAGCDFSRELLDRNARDFPGVNFVPLVSGGALPFETETFDFVMSVFVLEHVVRPDRFLSEMARICKPGGRIAILCPNYFGRLSMASQLIGWASDSGSHKLRRGHVIDAICSSITSRFLLPRYLKNRLQSAHEQPVFLLNGNPSCFSRPFFPDADAVYVTHQGEIEWQLDKCGCDAKYDLASSEARKLASERGLLYALFEKRPHGDIETGR